MAATIPCLLALLLAIHTASAITCYKCDSTETTLCSYGFSSFTYNTEDCSSGILGGIIPKQCVKFVAKSSDGKEYIARGCAPAVGTTVCKTAAKALNFFTKIEGDITDITCDLCDGDKCNSASKFTGFTFAGIILASLIYLF